MSSADGSDPTLIRMANTIDTSSLLSQMSALARDAGIPDAKPVAAESGAERVDFSELVKTSVENVNARSQHSAELTRAFEAGSPDVELTDVMIAAQKARISFEALTQVRNKMMSAYQDIMSTPL